MHHTPTAQSECLGTTQTADNVLNVPENVVDAASFIVRRWRRKSYFKFFLIVLILLSSIIRARAPSALLWILFCACTVLSCVRVAPTGRGANMKGCFARRQAPASAAASAAAGAAAPTQCSLRPPPPAALSRRAQRAHRLRAAPAARTASIEHEARVWPWLQRSAPLSRRRALCVASLSARSPVSGLRDARSTPPRRPPRCCGPARRAACAPRSSRW